ncbi:hypothetical protein QOZ98_001630 [Planomicrobium stackebrandtii]|uniref:Uncharacterized protein n=1 Tax=Planomicrobium stackebrandtii TaxID=253160 RepID=A0ABU0GU29_9BACL|nr:hypothetical protein [Planomicrobium stackebrandtii]MDQ0428803.1 hypothetical protein [Planomicrobium stackebrandtii]
MGLVNRRYSASYAKRYGHIGEIYQERYFAEEVDLHLGLLTVSSSIPRNPIQTKQPMVERLVRYPYSSFPLYWDDLPRAPAFGPEAAVGLAASPVREEQHGVLHVLPDRGRR